MADDLRDKKILVFGTGAVGGYYGGMLVKSGFDVIFIARGENFKALKRNGLTLVREGRKENFPIKVFDSTKEFGVFDYILVCVKGKDTRSAAESIKENIDPDTTVVSFQNGVENEEIIASVIGEDKVIGGLVFVASRLVEPGVVDQFGYNGGLVGEFSKEKTERVINLKDMFQISGIDMKISEDVRADLWNKLIWNASFNPLSVVTGKTVDKLLEEDCELLKGIMTEVRDVAVACGVNVRADTVEFNLGRSKGFTGFKTSMLQDFERGRPIELEELAGVVIRKAKEKNIKVPNIEKVYNEIKQKLKINV